MLDFFYKMKVHLLLKLKKGSTLSKHGVSVLSIGYCIHNRD